MKMSMHKRPPTFRIENEYSPETIPQYFQICVSVLEARQLIWSRPEHMVSYVVVRIGKKRQRTATKKGQESPFYKEYFVFDLYTCLRDLLKTTVTFSVMEPRCCGPRKIIGQIFVDLASIWNQPDHQLYHKWTLLTLPGDIMSGPRGFLKIDIALMAKWEAELVPMLQPLTTDQQNSSKLELGKEQQKTQFAICVYRALHLSINVRPEPTFVNIVFSGLVGKTGVSSATSFPQYNERVSFVEMFPGVNALVRLEIREARSCCTRIVASARLLFGDVSHVGHNGFLPTFGPTFLHMYGESSSGRSSLSDIGPFYKGSLLMSLKTTVPYVERGVRTVSLDPIPPVAEESLWLTEDVCVFCSVLEVSMLHKKFSKKSVGVSISMGHVPEENTGRNDLSGKDEVTETSANDSKNYYTGALNVSRRNSAYGYLDFDGKFIALNLNIRLPDVRPCMFRRNTLLRIIQNMENEISSIESRIILRTEHTSVLEAEITAVADSAAAAMQRYVESTTHDIAVDVLDKCQIKYQCDEIETMLNHDFKKLTSRKVLTLNIKPKLHEETSNTSVSNFENDNQGTDDNLKTKRRQLKIRLAKLKLIKEQVEKLIFKLAATWPDIIIWLINSGTKVAYTKLSPSDCIYSPVNEECGKNCGTTQTLYLKPIICPKHLTSMSSGCFCIAAKVEVFCWLSLFRQKAFLTTKLPEGYELKINEEENLTHLEAEEVTVQCEAFIYRAKLQPGGDATGLSDTNVRVNCLNRSLETQIKYDTLTPVWNQTLRFTDAIKSSLWKLQNSPPLVMMEVFDYKSKCSTKLVGRAVVNPFVASSTNKNPNLQWHSLYKGVKYVGQILLCVRLTLDPAQKELSKIIFDIGIVPPDVVYSLPIKYLRRTTNICWPDNPVALKKLASKHNNEDHVDDTSMKGAIEKIPTEIQPRLTTYKMDIYWWGLREVKSCNKPSIMLEIDELSIKSDIIKKPKKNCNFPNGRCSITLQAPLEEDYCPGISLRLYDHTTYGRKFLMGHNVIKNPNKLMIKWMPKRDRDDILHNKQYNVTSQTKAYYCQAPKIAAFGNIELVSHGVSEPILPVPPSSFRNRQYVVLPMPKITRRKKKTYSKSIGEDENVTEDWWSKFYCSRKECGDYTDTQKLVIYDSELENQPGLSKFKDWCRTIKLYRDKKTGFPRHDEALHCCFLKAGIVIYKWPPPENTVAVAPCGEQLEKGYFQNYQANEPSNYLVRVYVVRAFQLRPKDITGKADPYVFIKCGKTKIGDHRGRVKQTLNPTFGRVYECRCNLPEDYQMTISLFDYDILTRDDLIGSTEIDLEDRIHTKHRACCGLPFAYNLKGPNKWRDAMKPSKILCQLCLQNDLALPYFPDDQTMILNGVLYKSKDMKSEEPLETLCLQLLHEWHSLPIFGYHLVPEHVETRTLYHPSRPSLPQGKLQLWVDIFDLGSAAIVPPVVDIMPRKPAEYEFRLIVWDAKDVILRDVNLVTRKESSDVYVKAWLGDISQAQFTDIHYRSYNGEANFNWRMIFQFWYQHADRQMILSHIRPISKRDIEEVLPPLLHILIMDNDIFSADEYLGKLVVDLNAIPRGAKDSKTCTLINFTKAPIVDIFKSFSLRGWWPVRQRDVDSGDEFITGKLDLELHLLSRNKASQHPVGRGREPPHAMSAPNRPDTSFNFFNHPLKAVYQYTRRRGWMFYLTAIIIVLVVLFLVTTYLMLPQIILKKLTGLR